MTFFDWLIIILYFLTLLTQFYLLQFRSLRKYPSDNAKSLPEKKKLDKSVPNISIIVCARNEEEQLKKNIPLLLQQDYPENNWELIIVNDASTDSTAEVLKDFELVQSRLRVVSVGEYDQRSFPGKKHALHKGIEAAKFDIILLTDADCRPASDDWLRGMAEKHAGTTMPIILGYGAYKRNNGFLNKLIQWETLQTCMLYSGMCLAKKPYMGVGRNLLYHKKLYFEAMEDNEFRQKYKSLPSGDDDLLISKIANKNNTTICLSQKTHTISEPPKTFREWFRQKSRHVSTGKYYKTNTKVILGGAALSQGLFWILWFFICLQLLISPEETNTIKFTLLSTGFLAGIVRILFYWQNAQKWYIILGARELAYSYPLSEICLSFFQLIISPYIFWKNKKQWN